MNRRCVHGLHFAHFRLVGLRHGWLVCSSPSSAVRMRQSLFGGTHRRITLSPCRRDCAALVLSGRGRQVSPV